MRTTPPVPHSDSPSEDVYPSPYEWADIIVDPRPLGSRDVRLPHRLDSTSKVTRKDVEAARTWYVAEHQENRLVLHPDGTGETLTVDWYTCSSLTVAQQQVLTVLTYADGFRIAFPSIHDGNWRDHARFPLDGFGVALLGPETFDIAAWVAAETFRNTVMNLDQWFEGDSSGRLKTGHGLVGFATFGFGNHRVARDFFRRHKATDDAVVSAVEEGFRMTDADDVALLLAAAAGSWLTAHESWRDLRVLRDAGWTLSALTVLHDPQVVQQVNAVCMGSWLDEEEFTFAHDEWVRQVGLVEWMCWAKSPEQASMVLTAGYTLTDVRAWVAEGVSPSVEQLTAMAGLVSA